MKNHITIKYIFNEIKKYKISLLRANFLALGATFFSVLSPLLMPLLVDEVLLNKPGFLVGLSNSIFGMQEPYFYIILILIIVLISRFFFTYLNILHNKTFAIISKDIIYKIRLKLLNSLEKTALYEYENFPPARASSLMVVDIDTIDSFLGSAVAKLVVSLLTVIGVACILLALHWQLALFILILNPFVVFFSAKLGKKVAFLKKEQNRQISIFQESLNETLELFWQVKASNKEREFFALLDQKANNVKNSSTNYAYKSDVALRSSYFIFLSGFEVFRAASILTVAYSDLSVGQMLAIFGYLWVMMGPIQEILAMQHQYFAAKSALERINKIFELDEEPLFEHKLNPFKNTNANKIEIKNLYFSYDDKKNILENISLKIDKGTKIALIGASGSGKTTLAQVLVGFYPAKNGVIEFDGVAINDIGLDEVRENVYLILQNPYVFNDTIKFNLTLGKDFSSEEIEKAIQIAQLEEFIVGLEMGIETKVGKNGIKLSGGQRQRLSIARMILKKPNIIIFDESTSALDANTEENLFAALGEFLKEKTVIIIAHRLNTVRDADKIFVLEKGILAQQGSHEELLKSSLGAYRNLIKSQVING